MNARLVLRGDPAPDESLIGFVSRISDANGLGHCEPLLRRCGLKLDDDRSNADLTLLAEATGSSVSALEEASFRSKVGTPRFYTLRGMLAPYSMLMRNFRRICRSCLDEQGYASSLWHLKPYCACHIHGRMLADQCPACSRRFQWNKTSFDACLCGAEIVNGRIASQSVIAACAKIALAGTAQAVGPLELRGPGAVSEFLWYFGGPGANQSSSQRGQVAEQDAGWWADIVASGHRMLECWPTSFDAWAVNAYCRDTDNLFINPQLRLAIHSLRHHFDDLLPEVLDQFRFALAGHLPGAAFAKGQFWKSGPSSKYLPLCGAAKALRTTAPFILRLGKAGKLRIIAPIGPKRGYHAVCRDDVERLKAERAALLPETESAAVLGVSVFRLRQLRRAGFIETEDSELFPSDPRYDGSKLRKFVAGLSSHSVASIISYRPVTDKSTSLIDTIRLILSGDLKAFWGSAESRVISNLYVSAADARRFRAGHWEAWSDPDYLTASFAMLTLGTNSPALKELVRRGYLVGHGQTRDGKLRSVTRESFEEFDRTYISSKKIAIAHSLSTGTVTRRITAQGVIPAVPGIRSLKTACFWLRDDLGSVDIYAPERMPVPEARELEPNFRSISSVGRELFLSRDSLGALRRAGFFGPRSSNQHGLEVTSVEMFRERYISGSEIACLCGLSPKAVATRMRDLGFVPIYESAAGRDFVQLCWRREDASSVDWREPWLRKSRQQGARSSKHHVTALMSMRPERRSSTEEVTLTDAVALLGTKPEALTQAARVGYLAVSRRSCTGKIIAFDASSVREFDAKFVFNGQVAARLNVLPRTVYARMRSKGIVPAIPPRHGNEGAWHRADIESLETLLPLIDQSF